MTASILPALLLLGGAALGPGGLAILTRPVLLLLDPAAPAALAVFGIAAALRIRSGSVDARGSTGAAALQAALAGLIVFGGFLIAPPAASTMASFPAWSIAAAALGIAAATSFDAEDCIAPVVAGGVLLAFARDPAGVSIVIAMLEAALIAAMIAASGWLLLSRASAIDEQRVSTFASALLLGGAADYLSMSALLFGVAGGGCWRFADSSVREHVQRDVTYVSDSLLAFVLVLAGAHATYGAPVIAMAIGYIVLRAGAKLAAKWIWRRVGAPDDTPVKMLIAPGAFGVAFALNLVRALGDAFSPVLTVVVVGTIASSLIAALLPAEDA